MLRTTPAAALLLATALPANAQQGDRAGEAQPDLPADLSIPAAPALSPEEARETFELPRGFSIELVAAEPLVRDPVAMAFDGDGRLFVAEMRGYMPTIDGEGEAEPVGSIAVLEDEDGDGRMDKRTVFLDELVLPRALAIAFDGALVIAPPNLILARDTDGDLVADDVQVIDTGLAGVVSPEHAINGLLPSLDNWFTCVQQGRRYRFRNDAWEIGNTAGGGQWGVAKDDVGRLFFNTNSDPLRGDLFSSHYAIRSRSHGNASGVNVRLVDDFSTFPSRINPGVNRGYRKGTLREDFTLARVTAACGPLIYRGDALPADYRGSAFVCEPSGNLVQRFTVTETDGQLKATNAHVGRDFLTSTDERFRPVNLYDGPDGGLYIVDLYRGIIQHKIFMTTFLRKQVVARELDKHIGLGRIWRVVHKSSKPASGPKMSDASWTEICRTLGHPNGWWRDTAQRILVEEGADSTDAHELARETATTAKSPLARMHALWALEGFGGLDEALITKSLGDRDPRVQVAAVRVAEPFLTSKDSPLIERVAALGRKGDARLSHQVLLSLGEGRNEATDAAMLALLRQDCGTAERRSAVLSGLEGRHLAFLERLLADKGWSKGDDEGRKKLLSLLARAIVRSGDSSAVTELIGLIVGRPAERAWQTAALLEGILWGRGKGPKGGPGRIRLPGEPAAFAALAAMDPESQPKAHEVADALAWPNKPGLPPEEEIRPLTAEEDRRFARGREVYASVCVSCHQPSGFGDPGLAPPLRGSEWVLGSEERITRIVLQGLHGPIRVDGRVWDKEMPAFVADDDDIAAVLTYVRREWGHGADPVAPETVARIREATKTRGPAWTAEELKAIE